MLRDFLKSSTSSLAMLAHSKFGANQPFSLIQTELAGEELVRVADASGSEIISVKSYTAGTDSETLTVKRKRRRA